MSTITLKRTARILTETINIDYAEARSRVSEAVNELRIDRVRYNDNIKSWEISTADGRMLIDNLSHDHLVAIGERAADHE